MSSADSVKKRIEQDQRDRIAMLRENNQEDVGAYFELQEDGSWQFMNNIDLSEYWK